MCVCCEMSKLKVGPKCKVTPNAGQGKAREGMAWQITGRRGQGELRGQYYTLLLAMKTGIAAAEHMEWSGME